MGRFLFIVFAPTLVLFGLLIVFGRWVWVPLLALGIAWAYAAFLKASNRSMAAAADDIRRWL